MRDRRSSRSSTPVTSAPVKAAQKVARTAAQEVRIMGGAWKRTPLPVPVSAGLRPTPSRVRETLFNWLGQDLSGWRVLDAFAGSGALGLEAASRGAAQVQLLERDPALAKSLKAIQAKLGASQVQVWQTEALSWMRQSSRAGQFDLVFIDPPFDDDLFESALLAALNCVVDGGWVYLEAASSFEQLPTPDLQAALKLHRHGQAGAVHFHLFERVASASGVVPTAD